MAIGVQYKSDKEIQDDLDQSQKKLRNPYRSLVFTSTGSGEPVSISGTSDDIINLLMKKIILLENEVSFLKKRDEENRIQNLIDQNEISRKTLENIFELDPTESIDSKEVEGILSNYVKPHQNSAEWVRSVRDNP